MGIDVPARTADLTAAWLGEALGVEGIARVDGRTVGEGEGFVGEITRLSLGYHPRESAGPRSLVAKIPTEVGANRGIGAALGAYEREVRFYTELAPHCSVRAPECYYARCEPAPGSEYAMPISRWLDRRPYWLIRLLVAFFLWLGGRTPQRAVLLLEDLGDARLGDQVKGCGAEDAARALRAIVPMHAQHWGNAALADHWWIFPLTPTPRTFQHLYERALPTLRERYPGLRIADRQADWLRTNGRALLDTVEAAPHTLVHGDFRLDNLFFRDAHDEVVLFDWQAVLRGAAAFDVAYFLSGSLVPEVSRADELALVRDYHEQLVARGVSDYPLERFLRDYDRALLLVFHRLVLGIERIELGTNERARALIETMMTRVAGRVARIDPASALA